MVTSMLVTFFLSSAVVLYIYAGYPLMIFLLARLWPKLVTRGTATPAVSVIVAAYNEEKLIEGKIRNTLALDYPIDRLEVLIMSDGSDDGTDTIVEQFSDARVRLIALPRSGKANALNDGAREATGDILLFTDANVELESNALRLLVSLFDDPSVGGVSGRKKYFVRNGADSTEKGENLYWRWDQWQKHLESLFGNLFAADGAIYAIRRELYTPIEDAAQADDIAISTRVVLQGRRLLFEPAAVAWEEAPVEGREEFRRKVRVTNHSVRALLNLGPALFTSGFYSVELLSHKLVRHLIPLFLILLLVSTAFLSRGRDLFLIMLLVQVLFYLLAFTGFAARRSALGRSRIFSVPYYFCLVNVAALVGILSIARGRRVRVWSPRGV